MSFFGIRINIHHYFHWICPKPPKAKRLFFCLRAPFTTSAYTSTYPFTCQEITHMNLQVGQTKILDLVAKTASGSPARLDTSPAPEYSNSNPVVCSFAVAPDNLSVAITGLTPGDSLAGARADADLRPGVERFLDATPVTITVSAVEEEAATIELVERAGA